jgi:hypothetical protein
VEAQPNPESALRVSWAIRGLQYLCAHETNYAEHRAKPGPNVRLIYEQVLSRQVETFAEHGRRFQIQSLFLSPRSKSPT